MILLPNSIILSGLDFNFGFRADFGLFATTRAEPSCTKACESRIVSAFVEKSGNQTVELEGCGGNIFELKVLNTTTSICL